MVSPPPTQDSKKEVTLSFTTNEYLCDSFVLFCDNWKSFDTYFNNSLYSQSFKIIDALFSTFLDVMLIKHCEKEEQFQEKHQWIMVNHIYLPMGRLIGLRSYQ